MKLYHKRYGDDGPPLIILHGLLGSSGNWHTVSRKALRTAVQVYAVDQRNHGQSPHSDVLDYPTMAEDVKAFQEQQALRSSHVLGHSMGGKVAMQFAFSYPERVDRLIVVDVAPRAYPPEHRPLLEALRKVDLDRYEARSAIEDALARDVPSRPTRQFLLKNLTYDSEKGRYRWSIHLEGIYTNYDLLTKAVTSDEPYEGPTLFIRGGRSDYVTDDDLPTVRRLFPKAKVVTLEDAGHWVHVDAPAAFAEAVIDFLTG